MSHKILIVDDDTDILDLLKYNLEREGYEVCAEKSSQKALETARKFNPDLIILDIMMPKLNGIELCAQLRGIEDFKSTYIFFLTAKSEKYLQYEAFENGGDDYIEKITGLRALTHKVASVLKKKLVIRKGVKEISLGDLRVDRTKQTVFYKDKRVVLSQHEFELLYFLAQNPKKSITHESILHNIWGSEVYLFTKSIDTYINNIRLKVGASLISKLKGDKYRLDAY